VKQLLVTTKDAWQSLGIGRTRFFEILSEGQIHAVRLGRRTLIPVTELEKFAAALPQRNTACPSKSGRRQRDTGCDSAPVAHSPGESKL
jgi:excisionase family DNA binding protein